jgi:[protein-PII] uridylyltransferase
LRAEALPWWQALRLTALFHDIGKGLAGDHSLIGAGMVAEIARRMGLSTEVCDAARWLVREHLRMSRTSQRRDLSDPSVVATFAGAVGDLNALDALSALTWCDMVSVAPGSSSTWKVELLRTLHAAATASLRDETPAPRPIANRTPVRAALADGLLGEDDVRWLADELSDARWATFDDAELALAAPTLAATRVEPKGCVRLRAGRAPGQALLVVAAPDREQLLADLTAALAAERVNILRARIVTTDTRRALDVFDLSWIDPGGLPLADARRDRLVATLEGVLDGEVSAAALADRMQSESRIPPAARPPIRTRVEWSRGDGDDRRIVFEVKTRDRVGLLADIATWMSREGLAIDRALVTGEGDRAIDIFYVHPGEATDDEALNAIARRIGTAIDEAANDHAG